jgi:hypothetical protein
MSSCSHGCPFSAIVPFIAQYSPVLPDTVTTALYQQAASAALQHHYQLQRSTAATAATPTAALHSAGDDTLLSVLRIAAVLTCAGHVTQVKFYNGYRYYLLTITVQLTDISVQRSCYCIIHTF